MDHSVITHLPGMTKVCSAPALHHGRPVRSDPFAGLEQDEILQICLEGFLFLEQAVFSLPRIVLPVLALRYEVRLLPQGPIAVAGGIQKMALHECEDVAPQVVFLVLGGVVIGQLERVLQLPFAEMRVGCGIVGHQLPAEVALLERGRVPGRREGVPVHASESILFCSGS